MVKGKSVGERIFNCTNILFMCILMFLTLYPFWYAIIGSLDSAQDLSTGPVFLWPRVFTFASYREVLNDPGLLQALWVTLSRTVIVTVVSITYTAMFAYAYSRRYLKAKKLYTTIGFISMYFGGGLIPTFMLFNWLHLYDNYLVYILPSLFGGFWSVIILNANYKSIPDSLFESAKMDGASEFRIFFQMVLPLSKPVLAALSVFTAVGVWNDYTTTLYFTQSSNLQTLQYLVLKLIQTTSASQQLSSNLNPAVAEILAKVQGQGLVSSQTVELAAMVVAAIPVIVMYPFAQKYFLKGVLVGSIKE
ncbi:carbohydrate ABC transporter permease [Alicyclobacillus fastidiosus]|uniref:Carbohydrate ABC transporter permease n=1 Tax=Alicyclobacillus fastidiosus TaxID=392011 RepID=A0ABY6ZCY9_9BACL|nr:carbohydrate ABC transporter permease [Alicyclobacillus fastidiosus]WAH40049.1 carbohydrate ABC transporter permease [Alicyclobacillus fastidiosus]GMA61355.1 sugar ABC transporter permease [Alicyclobacillus fastidiosus]